MFNVMSRRSPFPRVKIPRRYKLNGVSSVAEVQACIENITGKPITIQRITEEADGQCLGKLTRLADTDLVQHSPTISELHRQQMILHEFAHIIQSEEGWGPELSSRLPLDEDSVYADAAEYHAEAVADMIASYLRKFNPSPHLGLNQKPLYERLLK